MPQMNPLWWVTLFTMFILILMMSNSMNYFYKNYKMIFSFKKSNKNSKNWKW
uniref:ATP synthase complex subunit 8 n=2 Tax=unclassified Prolachesilla TaxID=2635580 RepID=A0A8K1ZFJ8_9NEOP|nr:ATP synthase F0 subunit 8 [Prolachesilla sp. GRAspLA]UGS80298.1 ATP synthase F0 subunit 8 [Prolachesilla sp. GRA2sp1LA]